MSSTALDFTGHGAGLAALVALLDSAPGGTGARWSGGYRATITADDVHDTVTAAMADADGVAFCLIPEHAYAAPSEMVARANDLVAGLVAQDERYPELYQLARRGRVQVFSKSWTEKAKLGNQNVTMKHVLMAFLIINDAIAETFGLALDGARGPIAAAVRRVEARRVREDARARKAGQMVDAYAAPVVPSLGAQLLASTQRARQEDHGRIPFAKIDALPADPGIGTAAHVVLNGQAH